MANLDSKLVDVVGDRTSKVLASGLGISTVEDLLRHYPRRYVLRGELTDISELKEDDEVTILAEVFSATTRTLHGRKGTILEVVVTDGTSKLSLTFFNQPWRERELHVGRQGMFAGKVGLFKGKRQLSHPDYELIADGSDVDSAIDQFAGKYLAVYPATAKLPSWKIAQCIDLALGALDEVSDYLPEEIRVSHGYPTLGEALKSLHQPSNIEESELARERLTFDEAFLLQLLLVVRRQELRQLKATPRPVRSNGLLAAFDESLPFEFTAGQREVMQEIESDLAAQHPMHRLLQGEVGSGKTVVAIRAALAVVDSGGQAAFLAPTEVLAQQHLRTLQKLLGPLSHGGMLGAPEHATQLTLITGSQSTASRKEALALCASGEAGIVIGTHALLGESVAFKDLGLIIVDEQHRFGVEQRDALKAKSEKPPHLLVMTATPIPRTVAMTVFGDLDISTLRELPLGRQPITTHVVPALEKPVFLERAWQRVKEEVSQGHQAYVVAPRISAATPEDSDMDFLFGVVSAEIASVDEIAPMLHAGPLKGLRLAILHGQLSNDEKDATMRAFADGEIDVLVSTTVIEVGVDVPNATIMVIMDADRFGVSSLHQLRGRVGRGTSPGLCLLVTNSPAGTSARERLTAVAATQDGFELSRIDLEQRREGDVLGASQSGTRSHLRLLRVLRDEALIDQARTDATVIAASDEWQAKFEKLASALTILQKDSASQYIDKG
ncbi:MAG: ATP-dependent DNA helicase RecG [Actinobacteria bacterium]|nr:ATP-dependent DNA helicase RecG [Actinomycetota bacterium]MSX25050.1 ATP-dependent DNA helicase RecG [Actinomycetota bacterium]MSY46306.1 ATP-dependent DNA helicase RecG [Actinomycetota bacterium]MSY56883.1 ATP-dependent DNA helicase RecG [Actinomycetota bacterium]MTA99837.1 ATP-dependent DNA helicase RecG [Actinomycetota bacterium]